MGRHDHFHEVLGGAIAHITFDKHLVNLAVIQVADRAFDQVAFFIDLGGRDGFQRQRADLFPEALQVFIVALDFRFRALGSCRAHDQTGAIGHVDLSGDFFQLLAVGDIGDLAADATTACGVGHEHAVPTGQRQVSGQRGPLVATFFLDDLHQQDLTHLDDFLDAVFLGARLAGLANFFGHVLFGDRFNLVVLFGGVERLALVVFLVAIIITVVGLGVGFAVFRGVFCGSRSFTFDSSLLGRCIFLGCFSRGLGDRLGLHLIRIGNRGLFDQVHGRMTLNRIFASAVQVDDIHAAGGRVDLFGGNSVFGLDLFGLGFGARPRPAATRGFGFLILFGLGLGIGAFFGQQGLAIRNRDLVIIRVDFGKGQEAMAISAIVHKCRLERRLYAGDFCQVNIASQLAFVFGFKIKLFDFVSVDHHNAGFFRVGGIDKHLLCHVVQSHLNRTPPLVERHRNSGDLSGRKTLRRSARIKRALGPPSRFARTSRASSRFFSGAISGTHSGPCGACSRPGLLSGAGNLWPCGPLGLPGPCGGLRRAGCQCSETFGRAR